MIVHTLSISNLRKEGAILRHKEVLCEFVFGGGHPYLRELLPDCLQQSPHWAKKPK